MYVNVFVCMFSFVATATKLWHLFFLLFFEEKLKMIFCVTVVLNYFSRQKLQSPKRKIFFLDISWAGYYHCKCICTFIIEQKNYRESLSMMLKITLKKGLQNFSLTFCHFPIFVFSFSFLFFLWFLSTFLLYSMWQDYSI